MKIGIPRALLFHYYYPFWKSYFQTLGLETVETPPTNRIILDRGVKESVPEICVPIKVYLGHVASLLEMGVDYLFVPRFVSIQKGQYFCPKFMGLPDMLRHSMPQTAERLLVPTIDSHTENPAVPNRQYHFMEKILGISRHQNKKALAAAESVWMDFRQWCLRGYTLDVASDLALGKTVETEPTLEEEGNEPARPICLGVLGYVYNLHDPVISLNLLDRLKRMGVVVKTFEMIPDHQLDNQLEGMHKSTFWTFSDKLFAAGYYFYRSPDIDGLIHVTAFGCGPDSLLGKLLELDSATYKKPFMTIRIDEHSGENHLETRVEAFVDMLRRKKQIHSERGA